MRTKHVWLSLLALSACGRGPGEPDLAGEDAAQVCELPTDLETLLLANTAAQMEVAAFVGQATSDAHPEALYAVDLYREVADAGWISFMGCADGAGTFEPTCVDVDAEDGWWSCIQLSCLDTETLHVDAWYAPAGDNAGDGDGGFTMPVTSTGGTLEVSGAARFGWTLAAQDDYATVTADHAVSATHLGEDGSAVDVSFTTTGTVDHGDFHPAFSLVVRYPGIEDGHTWSTTLSFAEAGLDGALLRDEVQVATVLDVTPADAHHLVLQLDWTDCGAAKPPAPDKSGFECPPEARADCGPDAPR